MIGAQERTKHARETRVARSSGIRKGSFAFLGMLGKFNPTSKPGYTSRLSSLDSASVFGLPFKLPFISVRLSTHVRSKNNTISELFKLQTGSKKNSFSEVKMTPNSKLN